jgi:phosphodiesterase/alkaline phosphatase D-like protein
MITTQPNSPARRGRIAQSLRVLPLLFCLFARLGFAQNPYDPALKPFYHGVASGDPMADRVIIWTRVTPETEGTVAVAWKVATDAAMSQVVRTGVFTTDAARDYTVKVDVTGLQPYTTYYYSFNALGRNSLVGRTKTTPEGDASRLRFAVVSCNNYEGGYFSAFGRIADRNDLDAVIHLGDYIYEYGPGDYGTLSAERPVQPKNEIQSLRDYRQRYAWYRLDPDLRRSHQQHPFITVWDDHESANDAYKDGAENHQPETEGPWQTRKEISRRVYDEWMPIRGDASPIYRVKPYGNLVDLIMIDTRIAGRDQQINDVTNPALYAPNRTILGQTQREWLFERLRTSKAKWKIIGNQVIFSEFNVGWAASPQLGTAQQLESVFLDIWDGYPAERQRIIDFIAENKIDNVVILTGDFHSSFAFDVAARPSAFSPGGPPTYDPKTGKGSVAVEFATPSISSANFDENVNPQQSAAFEFQINKPLPPQAGPFAGVNPNPHMKYVDLDRHGYFLLDVTAEKAQADWYFVETILKPDSKETFDAGFYTMDGQNRLQKAPAASPASPSAPAPAPAFPGTEGTAVRLDISPLGTYQTGVFDEGAQEVPAYDPLTRRLFVINANDGTVDVLDIKNPSSPVKLFTIDTKTLAGGTPNSVAVGKGIVAVAIEQEDEATETQLPGKVALFPSDIAAPPAAFNKLVTVGALPDMLTFTPDGRKILVANEGEPSESADPAGSVSIIDVTGGIGGATVQTVTFEAFDGRENELRAKGVRIFAGRKASEDVEPEYIAVSPDGKTALVTLQEANAVAVLDIAQAAFTDILPLGLKDHHQGAPQLKQYAFNEPPIGKKADGEDILFGGLSGLYFEKEENGKQIFVTVPDRGPNGAESAAGRQFLLPGYVAKIIRFSLDVPSGKIRIVEEIPLTRKDSAGAKPITGFPNIPGVDEKPIDEAGNALAYDPYGADLEGIVVAPDGTYWLVDEYRPSIYHFNAQGVLIDRFVPKGTAARGGQPEGTYGKETLPAEYGTRRGNRGFEAMALDAKKGILYAFIQTPLANPDAAASAASGNIRILGIDPATGVPVAEYVYLLEKPKVTASVVDKMGDAAYDARTGRIYTIERDSEKGVTGKKFVFEMDFTGATNLLAAGAPAPLPGKTLEQHTPDDLAKAGIKPVYKRKVLNLPSLGYLPSDKPEGLALLPDGSLAVLNDNDFGLEGSATVALGVISFGKNGGLDASDRDTRIHIKPQPVLGMYMPDAVASFESNGATFYVTANEGDTRDEEKRLADLPLDATAFPDAAALQGDAEAGRLQVSPLDGDLDGDGDYDRIYAYGARSFTVWDSLGNQVFDSGDDLEKITAALRPSTSTPATPTTPSTTAATTKAPSRKDWR